MGSSPPPIPAAVPLRTGLRPRWSVVIPVHNAGPLLRTCLESVLVQDLGPDQMEIIVVDDASTDGPDQRVSEVAGDRVKVIRNEANLGAIGNFNACLRHSTGELVHLLHADDLVRPGFYKRFDEVFASQPQVGFSFCRADYIDTDGQVMLSTRSEMPDSGIWTDALDVLAVSNRVRPPGVVVRRSVYEQHGGFRTDLPHAADWEMWTRLASVTGVWFENQALAAYRRHSEQDTSQRVQSGENIDERIEAIRIIAASLPEEKRRRKTRAAMGYAAMFAANTAVQQARQGSWGAVAAQLKGSAQCTWLAVRG